MPEETVIRYSKIKKTLNLIVYFLAFLIALFVPFLSTEKPDNLFWFGKYLFCITLWIGMVWLSYDTIKQIRDVTPRIVLNNMGLQTCNTPFFKWSEVSGEQVVRLPNGKNSAVFLVYNIPEGKVKLLIDGFDVNREELDGLLKLYRNKFEQQNLDAIKRS